MGRGKARKAKKAKRRKVPEGKQPYPIVLVSWDDSCLVSDHWQLIAPTLDDAAVPLLISTAGLLLQSTKDYIIVALSVHDCVTDCVLKIPRHAVKSMKKLGTVVA